MSLTLQTRLSGILTLASEQISSIVSRFLFVMAVYFVNKNGFKLLLKYWSRLICQTLTLASVKKKMKA